MLVLVMVKIVQTSQSTYCIVSAASEESMLAMGSQTRHVFGMTIRLLRRKSPLAIEVDTVKVGKRPFFEGLGSQGLMRGVAYEVSEKALLGRP
jgi:hypothetical protein